MDDKSIFTKSLALVGTIIVWIPILFTVITSVIGTIYSRRLLFDFLMPAELFLIALVGALLLLCAARRARSYQKLIGWGLVAAIVFLVSSQGIAIATGLASGAIEPTGWPWAVVISSIAFYSFALIEIGIAGVLLVKKLYFL